VNREFFESLGARAKEFGQGAGLGTDIRAELWLSTGRVFVIKRIVEAADGWVQMECWDPVGEVELVALSLPYHAINHVILMKPKSRARESGFKLEMA
jgi:hypothetical protein